MMKGAAMRPYVDWIAREGGEGGWSAVSQRLSEEDKLTITTLHGGAAVPVELLGRVFEAYAQALLAGDRKRIEDAFRRMGRHTADEHLTGVYSIFARFASPHMAFMKLPNLLTSMYQGVDSSVEPATDGKGGVLRIRGLGGLPYTGPRISGWGERALERFGARAPQVTEREWLAGRSASDELVFDVRWA